MRYQISSSICAPIILFLVISLLSLDAQAVPAYARQTGENCASCHVSFPELTPFGRYFKLTGYTLGEFNPIPFAMMAQVGRTTTEKSHDNTGNELVRKDGAVRFSGASVFLAGKATDNFGAFIQWTYDNGQPAHSNMDNIDIRGAWEFTLAEKELIVGVTLHNNPTVQDVWNSTPAFGFPYTSSPDAIGTPVGTMIDGGLAQVVAGTGVYAYWDKTLYGELTFYRTPDGMLSFLRAGIPQGDRVTLDGENPYWRFAYNKEWGANTLMLGTYGTQVRIYSDPHDRSSPVNRFTDIALDAQYQYITDPHVVTAAGTWIHEKQHWNDGSASNSSDTLNTLKGKITYYYQRKYGATLGAFSTTGSADHALYDVLDSSDVSVNGGSPNTRGYIAELDYLPTQNIRLMLQYTGYWKYQGASSNIDGNGRHASDNNSLFLNVWISY
jgi:hypothetical protein